MLINILCIGDLVGKAGRAVVEQKLPEMIREHNIDFVVCNGENAAGGTGITPIIFEKLQKWGVDVVTLGDHCYRKGDIYPVLDSSPRIVRPVNLPSSSAGKGMTIVESKSGVKIAVISVMGQLNIMNADSPWAAIDNNLAKLPDDVKIVIVDFHAEATSEKIAMGWHCNGRASVVFGTHTHIPTADAGVLDKGTAFICDVGMTGPYDSILGRRKDRVLKHLTTSMPARFDMAIADPRIYALKATVDTLNGRALCCELLCEKGRPPTGGPVDNDDFDKKFQKPIRR